MLSASRAADSGMTELHADRGQTPPSASAREAKESRPS